MFGKKLSEYLRFQWWVLVLIVVAFLIRLGMSLAGVSNDQARWVSVTIVSLVGLFYYAVAVHTSGFGSYKQLFGLLLTQNVFANILISSAIVLGILTGSDNIFTAPEFSGGGDGKTWAHVGAHLVLGGILGTLVSWLIASPILFATRRLKRST
jgi:hypothetical protein